MSVTAILEALDVVVWVSEPLRNRIRFEGPLERLLGWDGALRELTSEALMDLVHPGDLDRFRDTFARHVAGETDTFSCEFRLRRGDGSYRWLMDRGQATRRAADGQPEQVSGLWIDIHDRKVAEMLAYASGAQAQTLSALLHEAIDALPEGIVIYDDQDRLTVWNSAIDRLYDGLLDGPIGGRTFEDLFRTEARLGLHPVARGREQEWVDGLLERRRAGDTNEEFRLKDGRRIQAQDKLLANGYRVGLRVDVTSLSLERERLAAILDGANLATWEWDAATGAGEVNDRWYEMFEADRTIRGAELTAWFRDRLDPDDRVRLDDAVRAHFRGQAEGVDIEVRAQSALGAPLVLLLRARGMQRLPDGRYLKLTGVMIEITTLRAVSHYLERARRDAVAESTAKTDLLARLNHEIRTPLNAVLGTISLLEARVREAEEQNLIALAAESGAQLTGLLDELLDLGQISPPASAQANEIRLDLIAEMIRSGYESQAEARGLTLDVLCDTSMRRSARGDQRRIFQILDHLVDNAVKHSQAGTVEVRLRLPDRDRLLLEILDEGPGIPAGVRSRLFEPLGHHLGNARGTSDGQGLGLAYVERLVSSLDGNLDIADRPTGGTRVRVWLPLVPADDEGPDETRAPSLPSLAGLRVLVAEDIPDGRLLLERMLGRLGAEAVLVEDGAAALKAIKGGQFDVALLDIRMPGIDGLETLHLTRVWEAETQRSRLPMLAMSASVQSQEVERYRRAGFLTVLAKPIRLQALAEALQPFLRSSGN